jgi:hypothetical protein
MAEIIDFARPMMTLPVGLAHLLHGTTIAASLHQLQKE